MPQIDKSVLLFLMRYLQSFHLLVIQALEGAAFAIEVHEDTVNKRLAFVNMLATKTDSKTRKRKIV